MLGAQVEQLRSQLNLEVSKRNQFLNLTAQTGDEMRDLRTMLDSSLKAVSRDASPLRIDAELRKLDEAGATGPLSPSSFSAGAGVGLGSLRSSTPQLLASHRLRMGATASATATGPRSQTPLPFRARRSLQSALHARDSSPPVRGRSPVAGVGLPSKD